LRTIKNAGHDRFFQKVHPSRLISNTCWEDPRIDRKLLEINPGSRVAVITSAGCNALDYLLDSPAEIHAVDVNPRQNALLQLKMALIKRGKYEDFFQMFGRGSHSDFASVFESIKEELPGEARSFWESKPGFFARRGLKKSFYDLTRWSFLFGRRELLQQLSPSPAPERILEIGCGTGTNLRRLADSFPEFRITGLDLSLHMLAKARRKTGKFGSRVKLRREDYSWPLDPQGFELVVFSCCLSMINPGWEQAVIAADQDLVSGGRVAVVDFHHSAISAFRAWMGVNHVRLDGHLIPFLKCMFPRHRALVRKGYGGLWSYVIFMGQKT
jgi:S-adenosylmethionine-diacylgycerolhomoserine-N-methlytransferase